MSNQEHYQRYTGAAQATLSRGQDVVPGLQQAGLQPVRPQIDQMLSSHIVAAQRAVALLQDVVGRFGRPIHAPPIPAAATPGGPQGPTPIYSSHRDTLADLERELSYLAETIAELV